MEIFRKKLEKNKIDFEEIINDKSNKKDKLDELKKIIDDCDIIEAYNIEYLKYLKEFEEKNKFKSDLEKYEDSISKNKIEENFPNVIEKINSLDKIKILIFQILNLKDLQAEQKEIELKNIFDKIKKEKLYKINFQIFPTDNLELYIFLLYQMFCGNIYNKINEYDEIHNIFLSKNDENKKLEEQIFNEINSMKKQLEIAKDENSKSEIKSKIDLKIENFRIFKIAHNKKFNEYLNGFYLFYNELEDYIEKRFFKKEKFNEEDIKLFEQFSYTLSNYEFENLKDDYINIWKESLEELSIEEINEKIKDFNKISIKKKKLFQLINNNKDLEMIYKEKSFIIEDINQYSSEELLSYLFLKKDLKDINKFELINSLKIQYFSDYIHKQILNNKWKNFLYEIFESKTIENLINSVHKDAKKIDKKEFKKIIDSVKFFNFNCTCLGQSFPFYILFINGLMGKKENNNIEYIKYYSRILVTFMHEILGHILIFIIRILFDKNMKSPETKGEIFSKFSNKRGRESGEKMHVKLFGRLLKSLTLKELCFIFNIKNYSFEKYEIFTENFSKCNDKELEIPDILVDLLKEIKLSEFNEIYLNIFASKGIDEFTINVVDGNERICNIFDFEE